MQQVLSSRDHEVSPEVVAACRHGDRDALRAVYEAYKDNVYSMALHFFHGDEQTAADVTQHVFVKLIGGMSSYRGDAAFSTWLYRLVVNACVDRARRRKAQPIAAPTSTLDALPAQTASHEDVLASREITRSVRTAVAALPPKLRMAILLRYFDDLSYADIAAALNCSLGTVASRLNRGHRLLAGALAFLRDAKAIDVASGSSRPKPDRSSRLNGNEHVASSFLGHRSAKREGGSRKEPPDSSSKE
jgi:RNA polymerase sigma-70 factor (ECF subfamily)